MSRLMRRGRRHLPSPLDFSRSVAANVESSSPARFLSPRQLVTAVPSQATALPTPIQSILTTTVFQTVAPTALPKTPSTPSTPSPPAAPPLQTQIPTTTFSSSVMPLPTLPTLQVDETVAGGGSGSTTVVDVAQGSNTTVIIGVAGAAGFSVLSIALFFYVRSKTSPKAAPIEKRKTLELRRAQALTGQLNRPYSSRGRLG